MDETPIGDGSGRARLPPVLALSGTGVIEFANEAIASGIKPEILASELPG